MITIPYYKYLLSSFYERRVVAVCAVFRNGLAFISVVQRLSHRFVSMHFLTGKVLIDRKHLPMLDYFFRLCLLNGSTIFGSAEVFPISQ